MAPCACHSDETLTELLCTIVGHAVSVSNHEVMECMRAEGTSALLELQKVVYFSRDKRKHGRQRVKSAHKGNREEREDKSNTVMQWKQKDRNTEGNKTSDRTGVKIRATTTDY